MVNEPKKNFDTSVTLSGLRLDNPVVPASGTFGYGNEYKDFYDINILGSFSFKGTTREARFGNPTPRIAECTAGMINAVGLQNPGIDAVIGEELPRLKTFFRKPVIANISGFSVEEYAYCCERIDKEEQVGLIEVNVSCPNVRHGGMSFGTSPEAAAEVTRAVKAVTTKPVYIKLSPNVTDIVAMLCQIFAKGFLRSLSVLVGLLVGYVLALFMGMIDFSGLSGLSIVALPKLLPFTPEFNIGAILSVVAVYLVSATETIGDTSALCNSALKRDPKTKEMGAAVCCDGFVSSVSGLFGCTPITSFSQNVGLAAMSGVVNRFTIAMGAIIMIIGGIFPAIGYVLTTIPQAVLGGCTIMMFGSILFAGFGMMARTGFSQRNMVIVSLSLSVGLGFTSATGMFNIFPEIVRTVFADNSVAVVFLLAVILNLVLPKNLDKA